MIDIDRYRVKPGERVDLKARSTREHGRLSKPEARKQFKALRDRLVELQEIMYAEGKHALLAVFQAMDAGGKDSTIQSVLTPLHPQGVEVTGFKAPTPEELEHDFLWRAHRQVPRKGYIGAFSRSHYEDVLIVRVKGLVPEKRWRPRYGHINAFEQLLHDEGTTVVKFFLHISKGYQKVRLQRRLDRPDKLWKFNPADIEERNRWGQYQEAFEEALSRCSTAHAPWYVIPAERRWYRDLLVALVLVRTLESLNMDYPPPTFDPRNVVID